MKFDAYQMVTDRICALLEQGIKPWSKPWKGVLRSGWSGQTGKEYSFLNQMLLANPEKKYKSLDEFLDDISGEWLTFQQIQERGGKIKKGEHGRKVVFFKMIPKRSEEGDEDEENGKTFPFLSVSTVFHIRQCEGVAQKYHTDNDKLYDFTESKTAEDVANEYLSRSGVKLKNDRQDRAFYRPIEDTVFMPLKEQFEISNEYYSTLFHELTHSTGHFSRLNRVNGNVNFGDETYSLEELVAEIGSASIMATLGIESEGSLANSAAYIKNWLEVLKNDNHMIVKAASRAEKAIRLILNIKENEENV